MSTRHVLAAVGWHGCALGLMALVLAGCATHRPPGGTLLTGLRPGVRPLVVIESAVPVEEE